MIDPIYMVLDFETRHRQSVKDIGAREYAPGASILCAAFRIGTRDELPDAETHVVKYWKTEGHRIHARKAFEHALASPRPNVYRVAHNAGFEREISAALIDPALGNPDLWICTASLAATHALPRPLEGACEALDLPAKKNPKGKLLIRRHCMPRKPSKNDPSIWNDDPDSLDELAEYCRDDVDATVGLFLALPPLHPFERKLWCMNQRFNARGIRVDRKLITAAREIAAVEKERLNKLVTEITGGISPTQRAAIQKWCSENGAHLPNMQKKTVDDALAAGLATGDVATVLKARQSASLTSIGKYDQFDVRTRLDGRVGDIQIWHGASTGRDAGAGVQVHNFPRGSLDPETLAIALGAIKSKDATWARCLLGDVMTALSSCLRGCLIATEGMTLFSGDFNAIEARAAFWLAGHDAGLKSFREGVDMYVDQATPIYDKAHAEITPDEREIGKRAFLGCGFGMGWPKFQETCAQFNTPVSDAVAKKAVKSYRTKHKPVADAWGLVERAAIAAVRNPGKRYTVCKTTWFVRGRFLYCQLPSGRRLAYCDPKIVWRDRFKNGNKKEVLGFWSVNPKTKQWAFSTTHGGTLFENVVQGVARDRMMFSQYLTEQAGYIPLMSVHDELVNERKGGTEKEFQALMERNPEWAEGLPVKVKVWSGPRYKKA